DLGSRRVVTSLPRLVHYLRRERPKALLSAMGHANVIAVLARQVARVPTRVVVSERSTFSIANANATLYRSRMVGHFMRWFYPLADGVVAVSGGVADDLAESIKLPRGAIDVVYNPVVDIGLTTRSRVEPDHPWLAPGQQPVVLGV